VALRFALLAALYEEPLTGYDLTLKFKTRLANVWNASHQQIYKELGKLHEEGLVSVEDIPQQGKPDKRLYRINETGEAALSDWVNTAHNRPPTRDPLLVKLFAGGLLDRDKLAHELADTRQIWREQLAYYRSVEAQYFTSRAETPAHFRFQHLALRRGILGMESNLQWLGEVEAMLADLAAGV